MENKIENWCCYSDLPSPSAYKDMDDTLQKNIEEFETAQTSVAKSEVLKRIELEFPDDEVIDELKNQVKDLQEQEKAEEDSQITIEIESGKYTLYTCIKSLYLVNLTFQKDRNYYVKIDDVASDYKNTGLFEVNSELKEYFDSIKPIHYVITDGGIGTQKKKNIFPQDIDFSQFFTKFV